MKNMTVIPPKPQKGNSAAKKEVKRLRVSSDVKYMTPVKKSHGHATRIFRTKKNAR